MNLIATLTNRLGISIRPLAAFLRIHHCLLARYDTAERTLPGTSLLEVAELYQWPKLPRLPPTRSLTSSNKGNCNSKPTGVPLKLQC